MAEATYRGRWWGRNLAPFFLPIIEHTLEAKRDDRRVTNHPAGCLGPAHPRKERKGAKFLCNRPTYCLYCWHRIRMWSAVRTQLQFFKQPHKYAFSARIHPDHYDLDTVKHVRDKLFAYLRHKLGFRRVLLWTQTHGDWMRKGVTPHFDGIVAGDTSPKTDDPDVEPLLHPKDPLPPLKPYGHDSGLHFWAREIPPTGDLAELKRLHHRGRYAGRVTWDTPAIWSSLYKDPTGGWAFIDFGGFGRKATKRHHFPLPPVSITHLDFIRLQEQADEWWEALRAPKASQRHPPTAQVRERVQDFWRRAAISCRIWGSFSTR